MNLFFYYVNNIYMKKIFLITLYFFNICNIFAIEDIQINNDFLIPEFDINTKYYNYYTSLDTVRINVKHSSDEIVYGSGIHNIVDGKNTIIISSSLNEEYIINIFKNYKKESKESYLKDLIIEGYDINFDKDKYEYSINIDDEKYLNIKYVLSNDNTFISIEGNGNFNKNDNIIRIKVNDTEYKIHVHKTKTVSFVEQENKDENKGLKKEIALFIIVTISSLISFLVFYLLFIFK